MLLLLRFILSGVFALAGVTKLLDLRGSRQSLQGFGVSERLIPALGIALPVAEVLVALALLPRATALYGAAGAAVLLAAFIAAIAVSLLRGERPDCHCFGQLHSTPVGWQVMVRNGALLVMAVVIMAWQWPDAGPGAGDWFVSLPLVPQVLAASLAIGLVALATRAILRARTQRLAPLVMPDWEKMAIPVGTPAPAFSLPGFDDEFVTLSQLRGRGKPVALIFTDPKCATCSALLPDVARWQREHSDTLTVVLVSRGTPDANRDKIGQLDIRDVLLQQDREVAEMFGVPFTPGAVIVREDGTIGTLTAPGDTAVRSLLTRHTSGQTGVTAATGGTVRAGAPAPEFTLPDLENRPVRLSDLRGQPAVLLFWDPWCSFCQQLLGQIRFWEARSLERRPQLLVVSKGDAATNAAQGFQAPVVLDAQFSVGGHFGASGTPSAILIDAEGAIASDLAVGGKDILALIGQQDLSTWSSSSSPVQTEVDEIPALATLPADALPLQQDCVHDEMLADGTMVLYNGCRQQVLTLNPTAALVWEYCDGQHDIDAIITEIAGVFPAAPRPDADVRSMLDSFLQTGLIVARPARP